MPQLPMPQPGAADLLIRVHATTVNRTDACALRAHEILGCRHLSRADFVVRPDHQSPVVILETNALPGMTSTSLYPEAAAESGVSFGELCHRWVQDALPPGQEGQVTESYRRLAICEILNAEFRD